MMRMIVILLALISLVINNDVQAQHMPSYHPRVIETMVNQSIYKEAAWLRKRGELRDSRDQQYVFHVELKALVLDNEMKFEEHYNSTEEEHDSIWEDYLKDVDAVEKDLAIRLKEIYDEANKPPTPRPTPRPPKPTPTTTVKEKLNLHWVKSAMLGIKAKLPLIDQQLQKAMAWISNPYGTWLGLLTRIASHHWTMGVVFSVALLAPLLKFWRADGVDINNLNTKVLALPAIDVGISSDQRPPSPAPAPAPAPSPTLHSTKPASPLRVAREHDPAFLPFKPIRRIDLQHEPADSSGGSTPPMEDLPDHKPDTEFVHKNPAPSAPTDVTSQPPASAPNARPQQQTGPSQAKPPIYVAPTATQPPTLRTRSPSNPRRPVTAVQPEKKPEPSIAQQTNEWFETYRDAHHRFLEQSRPSPTLTAVKPVLDLPLVDFETTKAQSLLQAHSPQQPKPQSTTPRPPQDIQLGEPPKPLPRPESAAPPLVSLSDDDELPEPQQYEQQIPKLQSHPIVHSQSLPNMFAKKSAMQPRSPSPAGIPLSIAIPIGASNPGSLSPEILPDSRSLRKHARQPHTEVEEPEPQPPSSSPTVSRSRSTSVDSESLQITRRNHMERLRGTPPPTKRDMRSSVDSTTPKREIEFSDNFESELEAEPQPESDFERDSDLE